MLCASLLATTLISLNVNRGIEAETVKRFAFAGDQVVRGIEERLAVHALALQGGAALFAKTGEVSGEEWHAYFERLRASQNIRGLQRIGFARLAPEARNAYAPIVFLEPFHARNQSLIGTNMLAEPVRRAALERARDSGEATLSGKLNLTSSAEEPTQVGVLMYVPVYRTRKASDGIEQRRKELLGWAFTPYRFGEFLDGILEQWRKHNEYDIDLHIYDGSKATAATLLFDSAPANTQDAGSLFYQQREIRYGDTTWRLSFDLPGGSSRINYTFAWAAVAGGLSLSALLFALMLSLIRTRAHATHIAHHLTEKIRQREHLLEESEYRWKSAVEEAGDGLWDKNMVDGAIYRSKKWQEFCGVRDARELTDFEQWGNHIHPDDKTRVLATMQAHLDGKTPRYACEHRLLCADGSVKWMQGRGIVVKRDANARPLRMIGMATDITARKRAEEALRLARISVDAAHDALFWITSEGRIIDLNQATCRLYGYTHEEFLRLHIKDINPVADFSPVAWQARFTKIGLLGALKFETTHRAKNGTTFPVEITTNRVQLDGKELNCAFVRDISERKRSETALNAALARADSANNAKSRFLAAASHDLRQPLAALSLYVAALQRAAPSGAAELAGHINDCANSMSDLLTDLLDVSKLDAGVVTSRPSDFAIEELLTSLVSINTAEASLKGLRLRLRPSETFTHTDHALLFRIIGNLITNAIRYTKKGGVLIACRRHQGKRWVEVWDSGIGIPADRTDIIFEEFRQLGDQSRSTRSSGSGLGLAIVAKAATLLGLQIRVRSKPGRGSMFAVELPPGQPLAPPTPPLTAPPATQSRIVALVDDNTPVRLALVRALEAMGHVVFATASGAELLRHLGEQTPDVVISDYRLSAGETGFDVINAVRAVFGAELPAGIITGDTNPALMRSMTKRGVTVHYKPLKIDALERLIRETAAQTPA